MNEQEKKIEKINKFVIYFIDSAFLILASFFVTYPYFVDMQEKPEIASAALIQSVNFIVIIIFLICCVAAIGWFIKRRISMPTE